MRPSPYAEVSARESLHPPAPHKTEGRPHGKRAGGPR
jgi:hypothetical protein